MAKTKVWGGLIMCSGKQRRALVKAISQAEAARRVGVSLHYFRGYWSITGNAASLEAMADQPPGTVLVRDDSGGWVVRRAAAE